MLFHTGVTILRQYGTKKQEKKSADIAVGGGVHLAKVLSVGRCWRTSSYLNVDGTNKRQNSEAPSKITNVFAIDFMTLGHILNGFDDTYPGDTCI